MVVATEEIEAAAVVAEAGGDSNIDPQLMIAIDTKGVGGNQGVPNE